MPKDISHLKISLANAAVDTARNLVSTAERLQHAAATGDFAALADISISIHTWSVDQIRGMALAITRLEN